MIEFEQTLSVKDSKKAIRLHYFGYKYTYVGPIVGLVALLILIYCFTTKSCLLGNNAIILFLLSLFLILRPFLYVQNVLKSLESSKVSPHQKLTIQITDDNKIVTSIEDNSSIVSLKDLYAYYDKDDFLFLYLARNRYFVIDKRQVSADQVRHLTKTLSDLNIRKR